MAELHDGGRTELILLGTSGGPRWRRERAGISSALVVGGSVYVVDFGYGAGRQLVKAGLDVADIRAGFVTHLHSDHISDLANFLLYGWYHDLGTHGRVRLMGPSSRTRVPPLPSGHGEEPPLVCPDGPVPGFTETLHRLIDAFATDVNDRMRDNARPHPDAVLRISDIEIPATTRFHPDESPAPLMEPFPVYEDENVHVSGVLVNHAPMTPAYAFRFDTADGSVVFSGDTGPCENLIGLAHGADVLVHEVIDEQWVMNNYTDRPAHERESMVRHHLTAHTSIPEVGKVAQAAGVRTLVLNHFVPGDLTPGRWHEAAKTFDGELVVGKDLDRVAIRP